MQREYKLGAWTLLAASTSMAHAQGASAPSHAASALTTNPPGGETWMIAVVGGAIGGVVGGIIVAVVVVSQLKKSLAGSNSARR